MKKLLYILLCLLILSASLSVFADAADWTVIKGAVSGEAFKITKTADGIQFSGPTDGTSAFNKNAVDVNDTGLEIKLINIPGYVGGAAGGKSQANNFFIGAGFLNEPKDLNYGNKGTWKGFGVLAYLLTPEKIRVEVIANNAGDWKTAASQELSVKAADGEKLVFALKRVQW